MGSHGVVELINGVSSLSDKAKCFDDHSDKLNAGHDLHSISDCLTDRELIIVPLRCADVTVDAIFDSVDNFVAPAHYFYS